MLMEYLVSSSKELVVRMKNQGGKDARLVVLRKVAVKHSGVFANFETEMKDLIRTIVE